MSMTQKLLRCFISAGEFSGDILAAQLVTEIRKRLPSISFTGIVGQKMKDVGVEEFVSIDSFGVMGLADVLKNLSKICLLEREILSYIDRESLGVVILVDFPGFHFRLAEQLKMRGVIVMQYVAPKLWAWGEHRIERLRNHFDLVLGIFPFEKNYFCSRGVNFEYTPCPHVERLSSIRVPTDFLGLDVNKPVICFLPGSRVSEVKRILPVICSIKEILKKRNSDFQFVIPVAQSLDLSFVKNILPKNQLRGLRFLQGKSLEAMKLADVAVITSGTATLECALLGTPMVVLYAMDDLSYLFAKRRVKTKWISLVNILLEKMLVKEYIQEFDLLEIVHELELYITSEKKRQHFFENIALLKASLSHVSEDDDVGMGKVVELLTAKNGIQQRVSECK